MPITLVELVLRLGASVLFGGAIGYERERREQPAGLRTHLLVSLASATFMIVSTQLVCFQDYAKDGLVHVDTSRIAANVVVGIGFLGGGAILHAGLRIRGLTTAASLWLVAAVGLASGAGMFVLALITTSISLFALVVLRYLERNFKGVLHIKVRITTEGDILSRQRVQQVLAPLCAEVLDVDYSRDQVKNRSKVHIDVRLPRHDLEEEMVKLLEGLPAVQTLRVRRLGN
ncbi:MAG: MgtC/SapB family protein [Isosphaeraceae bacterium]